MPELDARLIDPQIRQAAVLGVLIGLPPGGAAAIVTDSSPELVLALIEGQFGGQYAVQADRIDADDPSGEEPWRTTFTRVG